MADLSQLISHRFRGFGPHENTVESLTAALDWGVAQIEFDVRVTRCGTPLIYHDEAAPDETGKMRAICDVMAKQRASLGGTFAHMPTVDDLFAAIAAHPNRVKCLVDMKDAGFEEMLVALAHFHGITDRIVWVSWLPETLYAIRDLLPEAELCLSHWCQNPSEPTRQLHQVFTAVSGEIPRSTQRFVHGERSGWFVDGPLRGELRDMVSSICVPANMVTRNLVEDYHRDNIKVSTFSYVTRDSLEAAETAFGIDDFFIDAKVVFESFHSSLAGR